MSQKYIEKIVNDFIEKAKGLKVAVIGETIYDEFIGVSYEGNSVKSNCPVYKLAENIEKQHGGAAAIKNHLNDFVKEVHFFTNSTKEIVKTRYFDINDQKVHVEINHFSNNSFEDITVNTEDYDLVLVADFGHGFCKHLTINDGFYLMCQTNSNNFGFNRVSKWKNFKKKGVCIDLREASLQVNRKIDIGFPSQIYELFGYEINTENLFLTIGKKGALHTNGKRITHKESFSSDIVDTIGAGDTFFAFSALATHLDLKPDEILIIPSLAASLSTTWRCNEKIVTKESLLQHAAKFI